MFRKVNNGTRDGFAATSLLDNKIYSVSYRIVLFLLIQYVAPMILLVTLNAQVVISLRRSTVQRVLNVSQRHKPTSVRTTTKSMFESTRRVTIVVIVVVMLCTVCHLVAMVAQVLWSIEVAFSSSLSKSTLLSLDLYRRHISQASNVLVTLNSAVNFLIYCMCSRHFRAVLVRQFCCCLWCRSRLSCRQIFKLLPCNEHREFDVKPAVDLPPVYLSLRSNKPCLMNTGSGTANTDASSGQNGRFQIYDWFDTLNYRYSSAHNSLFGQTMLQSWQLWNMKWYAIYSNIYHKKVDRMISYRTCTAENICYCNYS